MFDDLAEYVDIIKDICYQASYNAGWWNDKEGKDIRSNPYTFSNKLMLIVSEISEAMEADRKGLMDDKLPHRKGTEVELADAIIRICDLAGAYNLRLGEALVEKMKFNSIREDHKLENRNAVGGKSY